MAKLQMSNQCKCLVEYVNVTDIILSIANMSDIKSKNIKNVVTFTWQNKKSDLKIKNIKFTNDRWQ